MKKVFPGCLIPTNQRADLAFERGAGPYLFGSDGRRYLDFFAGIGVTSLGHAHPHLQEIMHAYADRVWHVSNNYRIPEQEKLAERLTANSFASRAFFCNSGLEAAEAAIKCARRTHFANGESERVEIITIEGAFHGRSLASLAATNNKKYLEGFGPVTSGFSQVEFADLEMLRGRLGKDTAAVLLEPVQGEGGIRPLELDYLREVRRLCDASGALLIVDEVQCGMGRTGRLFAHEWAGIKPDIMMLAKGLGGGFPVGAVLTTERVAKAMTQGSHGSTFGGNPLAMAMANAVLDIVSQQEFLERVCRLGQSFREKLEDILRRYPTLFVDVRGSGLMLGVKCNGPVADYVDALRDEGMLAHTAGDNVMRFLPPLIIEVQHIDEAVRCLERMCLNMSHAVNVA